MKTFPVFYVVLIPLTISLLYVLNSSTSLGNQRELENRWICSEYAKESVKQGSYHYNQDLSSCLYLDAGYIKNIYTNETIAYQKDPYFNIKKQTLGF